MILEVCHRVNGGWVCRACNYKSKLKDHVFEHVESKHINDGLSYFCGLCGKAFKARNLLRMHLRTKHHGISGSNQNMYF